MEKNSLLEIRKELDILKSQCKPTDTWQSYLDDDDEMGVFYIQEGIDAVANVLDQFIQALVDMDDYANCKMVEETIHKLILDLNNLSHVYEGMIETGEREELVDFILSVLDIIEYEYIGDITEQWREW
jgi:hypothetical protein